MRRKVPPRRGGCYPIFELFSLGARVQYSFSFSQTLKGLVAGLAAGVLLSGAVSAKTPDEIRATCQKEHRPCVGLVLSGGGARGFAHVGVLKVLEALGIEVDVVTGTSMGSMIGGAWAAGYTADEIEDIVLGVDWAEMLSSRPSRDNRSWRDKENDEKGLLGASLGITASGHFQLPTGVVANQELGLFLENKTGFADSVKTLTNLPIPFAAVATNLVNGERVVLKDDVTLQEAMRASMSVPGAFKPAEIHGELLVDGGLTDNLPVDLARELGADVIIAVNVGTPLYQRDDLDSVVTVLAQMVNLLTEQNVRRSLASLTAKDVLISPDLTKYTSADLDKGKAIIEAGYAAANQISASLKKLAVSQPQYAEWARERETLIRDKLQTVYKIDDVKVEGLTFLNPKVAIEALDMRKEGDYTQAQISQASRRLWGEGYFHDVNYVVERGADGSNVLVFKAHEEEPLTSVLRIGGRVQSDLKDMHKYHLLISHTLNLVNSLGATWQNEVQLGEVQSFKTLFDQPIAAGSPWHLRPELEIRRQPYDQFLGNHVVARYRNQITHVGLGLGRELGHWGFLSVTGGWMRQSTTALIGGLGNSFTTLRTPYMSAKLAVDTLDDVNFPTRGLRLDATWTQLNHHNSRTHYDSIYQMDATWAQSLGRWTLMANAKLGRSALPNVFRLGGAFSLPGAPIGRWTGSDLQYGSLRLSRNLSDKINFLGIPFWAGVSYETGRSWNREAIVANETLENGWHQAVGLYFGADTLVGPMYVVGGHTFNTGSGLYLLWGHSF